MSVTEPDRTSSTGAAAPSRREWLAIGLLALVQGAVMLWLGAQLGTSRDEEYALDTTAHGPVVAFGRALTYELQAPLYFVICAIWREANGSMLFARSLSTLFTVAGTVAVGALAKRLRPGRSPLGVALAYAVAPLTIYAAVDIRAYALALLLATLAAIAFVDGWWLGRAARARAAFVAFASLGVFTHYYAAFLIAALGAGLALAAPRRLPSYLASAGVVGLATVAVAREVSSQIGAYDFTPLAPLALAREVIATPLEWFAVPAQAFLGGHRAAYVAVACAMLAAAAYARIDPRDAAVRLWGGTLLGVFACYGLAAVALHVEFAQPRHYFAFAVPFIAFATVALASIPELGRRVAATRTIAGIYATTACLAAAVQYGGLAKDGDWKRIGPFVGARVRASDAVAIFEPDAEPAFARFYTGIVPARPFPHAIDPNRYDPRALQVTSTAEARAALRALMAGRRHGWLAIDCDYAGRFRHDGCMFVRDAVDAAYPHRGRTDFFRAWVAELPSPR